MMLARVADSLYWMGRYIERAEHYARLADVMINATLDQTDASRETAIIALTAAGDGRARQAANPYAAARSLLFERADADSVLMSLARARENGRQVRDQMTTETWERLNLLWLKVSDEKSATEAFEDGASAFLHDIIADLHLFKGAADATMSHGEGWRFLLLGVHLERAQLIARLLKAGFGSERRKVVDHIALMSLLRMACALEPYLRVYTADIQPRLILEFLLFDEDFPRSLRFSTARIEEHLKDLALPAEMSLGRMRPERLAGRMKARLEFADVDDLAPAAAEALLKTVTDECAAIHDAVYDSFVAYPLELRLPA
jgi:uncharacterized alpha-E superfamily protein